MNVFGRAGIAGRRMTAGWRMACLVAASLTAGLLEAAAAEAVRVTQFQMGMIVHITAWADDPQAGRHACGAAFQRMRELNRVFSDYEPDTELKRLCAAAGKGPVPVGPEMMEVLLFSRDLAERTGGAFDPTAAPLIRLWRQARRAGRLPDPAALEQARALTGWRDLVLDPAAGTAELRRTGMLLDLGAVAKGYMADQTLKVMREKGFPAAMIEAGGDTVFGDAPPGRAGWPVESPAPGVPALEAAGQAVSISGDSMQHLVVDGVTYSHVVDPRTGAALTNRVVTVVVGPGGMVTDALSTAGSILDEAEWRRVLEQTDPAAKGWRFVETVSPQESEPPPSPGTHLPARPVRHPESRHGGTRDLPEWR